MERKDARVNTKESEFTQHFHVPILKVGGAMGGCSHGVDGKLVTGSIYNGEVGQTGIADGW